MVRYGAAALAMAGLVLAGCASTQSNSSGTGASGASGVSTGPSLDGPASVSPSSSDTQNPVDPPRIAAIAATCPANQNFEQPNGPAARIVPADLQVSWVLRCTISNKGGSRMLIAERSVGDTSRLLRALKSPSALHIQTVCPMLRILIPYFALVEPNGKIFVPKVPTNNCGMPQSPVTLALNALRFTVISTTPIS